MEISGTARLCVLDDRREAERNVLVSRLTGAGYDVRTCAVAEEFPAEFDEARTDAVVADFRLPAVDGVALQRKLRECASVVAAVFLTDEADVRTAVWLMEQGAAAVLHKPYRPEELTAAVEKAVARTRRNRRESLDRAAARTRYARLTDDEKSVLKFVVAGLPNKAIALRLDLSLRTVDRRRSAVMKKLNAESIAELALLLAKIDPRKHDC